MNEFKKEVKRQYLLTFDGVLGVTGDAGVSPSLKALSVPALGGGARPLVDFETGVSESGGAGVTGV